MKFLLILFIAIVVACVFIWLPLFIYHDINYVYPAQKAACEAHGWKLRTYSMYKSELRVCVDSNGLWHEIPE